MVGIFIIIYFYIYIMTYYDKYIKYKNKYLELQKSKLATQSGGFNNQVDETKKNIILFKADWCGHCQQFKDTWKALKSNKEYENKYNFIEYDADADKNALEKYKIDGFPTLLIQNKNEKPVQYEGERKIDSIIKFINTV